MWQLLSLTTQKCGPSWRTFALHNLTKQTKSIFHCWLGVILCQAAHEPFKFISFLPGDLRTMLACVSCWGSGWKKHIHSTHLCLGIFPLGGTEKHSHTLLLFPCLLFNFCLLFHIGSNQLQGESTSPLNCHIGNQWDLSERTIPPLIETSFPAGLAHWGYWDVPPVTASLWPFHIYEWPEDLWCKIHMVSACSGLRVRGTQPHANTNTHKLSLSIRRMQWVDFIATAALFQNKQSLEAKNVTPKTWL